MKTGGTIDRLRQAATHLEIAAQALVFRDEEGKRIFGERYVKADELLREIALHSECFPVGPGLCLDCATEETCTHAM